MADMACRPKVLRVFQLRAVQLVVHVLRKQMQESTNGILYIMMYDHGTVANPSNTVLLTAKICRHVDGQGSEGDTVRDDRPSFERGG